jgi:glycosyltransferase involved in cell wall biosynthesis
VRVPPAVGDETATSVYERALMLISLVICTRNRAVSLQRCFDYVRQLQSPGAWELVVVDNGSTDETPRLIKEFAASVSFPVLAVTEPRPGLGHARNAGIAQASGDIVAFTDDDCYVDAAFLVEMVSVFKQEEIGFMGGRVLLYDQTDAPDTIRTETREYQIAPYSIIRAGWLLGANMAFRRSVLAQIGVFDPAFGAGGRFRSCEEAELQTRASLNGATGLYHPGPLVWHHHGRKSTAARNKLVRNYDYGRGAYYAKLLLERETRIRFLRSWYWWAAGNFRDRMYGTVFRDISGTLVRGGLYYTWLRIWSRAGHS